MHGSLRTPPRRLETLLGLGLVLALGTGSWACSNDQGNSKNGGKKGDEKAEKKADDKADDKADSKKDAKADAGKKDGGDAGANKECAKYCVEGTPCGDECIEEGTECKAEGEGSACAGSERPAPKFKKGDRALKGLIAADLPAYNKAQGDTVEGYFTLEMAFEGDDKLADKESGKLIATFDTTMGKFDCELFEEGAPLTVANFVGLGRGTRPFLDKKTKEWMTGTKFYDDVLFHRVIEGFMVQTGDRTGTGRGSPGYFVPDEFDKKLRHNKPGILSMANRNRPDPKTQKLRRDPKTGQRIGNTGSSQFFITTVPTPQLDDRHTVFGMCDAKIPKKISEVKVRTNRALGEDHKPVEDVKIKTITFSRKK